MQFRLLVYLHVKNGVIKKTLIKSTRAKDYPFVASSSRFPSSDDDISQSAAKAFLPPHTSIWRANVKGAWMAHVMYTDTPRMSEPWVKHEGYSYLAMKELVRRCWNIYNEYHGIAPGVCLVQGLFT